MTAALFCFAPKPVLALQGWSEQDKAEFFRAVEMLDRIGVRIELELGSTDEDEPWAVFCSPTSGDVLLHIARLNGRYVVATGTLPRALEGSNLRELIGRALDGMVPVLSVKPRNALGSDTDKQSSVLVHPSTLLLALIATAWFHSLHAAEIEGFDTGALAASLQELESEVGGEEAGELLAGETGDDPAGRDAWVDPAALLDPAILKVYALRFQQGEVDGGAFRQLVMAAMASLLTAAAVPEASALRHEATPNEGGEVISGTATEGDRATETALKDVDFVHGLRLVWTWDGDVLLDETASDVFVLIFGGVPLASTPHQLALQIAAGELQAPGGDDPTGAALDGIPSQGLLDGLYASQEDRGFEWTLTEGWAAVDQRGVQALLQGTLLLGSSNASQAWTLVQAYAPTDTGPLSHEAVAWLQRLVFSLDLIALEEMPSGGVGMRFDEASTLVSDTGAYSLNTQAGGGEQRNGNPFQGTGLTTATSTAEIPLEKSSEAKSSPEGADVPTVGSHPPQPKVQPARNVDHDVLALLRRFVEATPDYVFYHSNKAILMLDEDLLHTKDMPFYVKSLIFHDRSEIILITSHDIWA